MRAVISLALLVGLCTASDPDRDPFRLFGPDVAVTTADGAMLARGLPIILILDAEGHELAVFTAIEVGAGVTADKMVASLILAHLLLAVRAVPCERLASFG